MGIPIGLVAGDLPARNARRRVAEERPPNARAGTSEGHARRSFIRRHLTLVHAISSLIHAISSLVHTIPSLVHTISSLIRPYPSLVPRRPSKGRSRRSEGCRRLCGTRRPSKGRSRRSEGGLHPWDGTRHLRDEIRRPVKDVETARTPEDASQRAGERTGATHGYSSGVPCGLLDLLGPSGSQIQGQPLVEVGSP